MLTICILQKGNEMAFNALEAQLRDLFKELKYLNSNRHDNILALYGYSYEDGNFCLVSQFMPNGSLEDRLLCRVNIRENKRDFNLPSIVFQFCF